MRLRFRLGFAALLFCVGAAVCAPCAPCAAQAEDHGSQPLSEPADSHALAARDAMKRRDYAAAVDETREALRQQPDMESLRVMLVQALTAAGRLDEAVKIGAGFVAAGDTAPAMLDQLVQARHALEEARGPSSQVARPAPDSGPFLSAESAAARAAAAFARGDYAGALLAANAAATLSPERYGALRDAMRAAIAALPVKTEHPADKAAAAANDALARRDFAGARVKAAEAARLDPENPAYLQLLARIDAAEHAPAAPAPSPAYAAADAAYRAFAARDWHAAVRGAREAVRLEPGNRTYRTLLVAALSAAGDVAGAEMAASAALKRFRRDAELLAQRGYLRQKLGRPDQAAQDFSEALAQRSGSPADRERWRFAQANALIAAGRPQQALNALRGLPETAEMLLVRAAALKALGRDEEALAAYVQAQSVARTADERLEALRGRIDALVTIQRGNEARALFDEALATGALGRLPKADFAYLASRVGDYMRATQAFGEARAEGSLPPRANLDAGYAAMRAFDNAAAISFFKAGVDAAHAGLFPATEQEIFQIRRQISELDRSWGINGMISYGKVGITPGSALAVTSSAGAVAQVGSEIYWRPPVIGYRDRASFELFARAFQTLYDDYDSPVGWSTNQATVGARWKPFGDYNLIFEGARVFGVGDDTTNNWMLRAAFSQGQGLDLRVDDPSWLMWNVGAEAVRYFESRETILNAEGRIGWSHRIDGIGDGLVLTPYGVLGGGYDSTAQTPTAFGIGPGFSARLWLRGDTYHAPRSFLDASVQYRVPIVGGDRARGIFAQLSFSY